MKNLAIFLLVVVPLVLRAEVRYKVVPLVPDNPDIANSGAGGINQNGDVVGSFFDSSYSYVYGFRYTDSRGFTNVGFGPTGLMYLTGINETGQICGYARTDVAGHTHVFRYSPEEGFVDLSLTNWRSGEGNGINKWGQVTGFYEGNDGSEHAFLYTDGAGMQDLGVLNGENSGGRGINNLGWVTGTSGNRAFSYKDGVMTDIGPGSGWAINDSGVVAGEISWQPVVYREGQVRFLGGAGSARGINNHNIVVGGLDSQSLMYAFIWSEQEGIKDLNTLIDPSDPGGGWWYLESASAINDAGQIVGSGFSPNRGTLTTPFRLDPIPPRLQIALDETNVVISWSPHWPWLVLETANVLTPASWQAVPRATNSPVVLPILGSGQIFRLSRYE